MGQENSPWTGRQRALRKCCVRRDVVGIIVSWMEEWGWGLAGTRF